MIIVGCNTVDRDVVVARIAELEHELFGVGAWSRDAVGQELDDPARTYLLAVVWPGYRTRPAVARFCPQPAVDAESP